MSFTRHLDQPFPQGRPSRVYCGGQDPWKRPRHGTSDPLALAQRRQIDASGLACERIQVSISVENPYLMELGDDGHDDRFDTIRVASVVISLVLRTWVHCGRIA